MSPQKINRITAGLLVVGLGGALAIYLTVKPATINSEVSELLGSKGYRHELRVMGGKWSVTAEEFRDWCEDLWQGQNRARTVAVLTVAVALAFRFVAARPHVFNPDHRAEKKPPPAGS